MIVSRIYIQDSCRAGSTRKCIMTEHVVNRPASVHKMGQV
ncbi:unnamed protein product [Amoebophrya sp. A120]|nr:unnamed protein product [Amoebophrya sp. A120]|eukprot:GSA120T00015022001.1